MVDRGLQIVRLNRNLNGQLDLGWISSNVGTMLMKYSQLVFEDINIPAVEIPDLGVLCDYSERDLLATTAEGAKVAWALPQSLARLTRYTQALDDTDAI